jgi:hypothetical protein
MKIALQTGMSIVQSRLRSVGHRLETELTNTTSDMTEEDWIENIATPCKDVVETMDKLSTAFSKGLVLDMLYKFTSFTLCGCLILSPERQRIGERTGLSWMNGMSLLFLIVWMVGSVFSACIAIYGPASVSTGWYVHCFPLVRACSHLIILCTVPTF